MLKEQGITTPYELTYLEGSLMEDYLHDLQIVQEFVALNREIILNELAKGMKWKISDSYSCISKDTLDEAPFAYPPSYWNCGYFYFRTNPASQPQGCPQ